MDKSTESSKSQKRRRSVMTIQEKLKIIEELDKGATASALNRKYNVPRQTISDLKKNAADIKVFASQLETPNLARKTMKKAMNKEVDTALYMWFTQKRSEGVPISGDLLCAKALAFNTQMNGDENFKASSGWLDKFKNRHGIRSLSIQGEKTVQQVKKSSTTEE